MAQLSLYDLNRLKLDATKAAVDKLRVDAATINNGLTVQTSVPKGAKFTDTIYTHPATHPASIITGLSTVATSGSYNDLLNKPANLPANGGNADTVDSCHVNDSTTTVNNLWTSKKTQDKLNEKENTIVFSGTTKPTKNCVWIDTTATVYSSTNAKFVNINGSTAKTWHLETNDTQVKTQNNTSNLKNDLAEVNKLIGTKADNVTVTQQKNGIMSKEDKIKLDNIAAYANNYVHPATHPASMITGLPTKLPANGGNSDTVGGKAVNDEGTGTAYLWTAGKIQSLLNGKSNVGHSHDDRYYTESEMNVKLNGKSDTTHGHSNYIPTTASCNKNWNWSGQGGQPQWLWGGNDPSNMYVYNPSNFNVSSASVSYRVEGTSTPGSWVGWRDRTALLQLNTPESDGSAYNIWKATKVGSHHLAAMDVHDPTRNGSNPRVRIVVGNSNAEFSFEGNGCFIAPRVYNAVYNDYAEWFKKEDIEEKFEPGDLISIGEDDKYTKSTKSYDSCVVGVFSDTYGHIVGGEQLENMEDNNTKFIPIGLSGRVSVKLTGKIKKGDLIVSSDIPGVAMKMQNFIPGTIIGKAVEDKNVDEIKRVKMLIFNS